MTTKKKAPSKTKDEAAPTADVKHTEEKPKTKKKVSSETPKVKKTVSTTAHKKKTPSEPLTHEPSKPTPHTATSSEVKPHSAHPHTKVDGAGQPSTPIHKVAAHPSVAHAPKPTVVAPAHKEMPKAVLPIQPKPISPAKPVSPISVGKDTIKPRVESSATMVITTSPSEKATITESKTDVRPKISYNEMMTVKDLADAMGLKVVDVIKKLLILGTPASMNQRIQSDVASLLADAFGFQLNVKSIFVDEPASEGKEDSSLLKPRPPVVTVMGHVDHGKTSLLDAIRSTTVALKEAGGITQHIGAYQVKTPRGVITFLDTPGHEAFTAMRARGAMATDIVILVVAADDSVMPQTIEAIDHAKAAGVPIVVAINKVDLPQANVNRVKQELAQHELMSEDWGGKTVMVEVSARTKHNIDKLLEMVLLESEMLDLKANPDKPARGVVLEAKLDPKRGVTATGLVQSGTLHIGDVIVCGLGYGRIRAMADEFRNPLKDVAPATPVEILGLSKMPQVGDQFSVVGSDREAREISERRQIHFKEMAQSQKAAISLETVHTQIEEGKIKDLSIILKADVQGSLQALQDSLGKLSGGTVSIKFVHMGVGNVNESDVLLAEASAAVVFGFNVKVESGAEAEAKRTGIDIRVYRIIYEMLADIRAAMEGLLKPEEKEAVKGKAEVRQVFAASRVGQAAGCMVVEGKMTRGHKARVLRNQTEVFRGAVSTLRRFKDDVKEVEKGYDCGLSIDGFKDFQVNDVVESFVIEKHSRRLDV